MILNLRPQSLEFLDCIIEELDARQNTDQQSEILSIIRDVLGYSDTNDSEFSIPQSEAK